VADGTGNNIKLFFEEVKTASFIKRIFSWNRIRVLSYEVYKDYDLLIQEQASLNLQKSELQQLLEEGKRKDESNGKEIDRLKEELANAKASYEVMNNILKEKERKIGELERSEKGNLESILELKSQLNTATDQLRKKQDEIQTYGNQIAELNQAKTNNLERIQQLQREITDCSEKKKELTNKITECEKTITGFQTAEESRIADMKQRLPA